MRQCQSQYSNGNSTTKPFWHSLILQNNGNPIEVNTLINPNQTVANDESESEKVGFNCFGNGGAFHTVIIGAGLSGE